VKLVIINYGSGNLHSVAKAFERAGADSGWRGQVIVSDDPAQVRNADYIVLPGVGAFGDCARGLSLVDGMRAELHEAVRERSRPFLGICVGMQLMADRGLEHGVHQGLGWIGGEVVEIQRSDPQGNIPLMGWRIPHMGWNDLILDGGRSHPVFAGLDHKWWLKWILRCIHLPTGPDGHGYFVHSYHFIVRNPAHLLAHVDYGGPVTAAIGRDNMLGVQFHPEKSQALGLRLLANFLRWKP
jgi:glutamine amidotransferase